MQSTPGSHQSMTIKSVLTDASGFLRPDVEGRAIHCHARAEIHDTVTTHGGSCLQLASACGQLQSLW